MTRPPRDMLLITLAAALIACGGGFFLGRASGEPEAPALPVKPVERIDRPAVEPEIPVPTRISIPGRLPQ